MQFAGLKKQWSKRQICPEVNPLSRCHWTNVVLSIWWRSLPEVVRNSIANLDIRTATPFIKLARGLGWYLIIQKEHSQCSGKIDLPNANIEKLLSCESSGLILCYSESD